MKTKLNSKLNKSKQQSIFITCIDPFNTSLLISFELNTRNKLRVTYKPKSLKTSGDEGVVFLQVLVSLKY